MNAKEMLENLKKIAGMTNAFITFDKDGVKFEIYNHYYPSSNSWHPEVRCKRIFGEKAEKMFLALFEDGENVS